MTNTRQLKSTASVLLIEAQDELIPIIPAGQIVGDDGRTYTLTDPEGVVAASIRPVVDLMIDRDHAYDLLPPGAERPAAGWIKELVVINGAIWGKPSWTIRASQQLRDKEYRYISPTFLHTKDGIVTRILRASLTNFPNFEMKAVASAQEVDAQSDSQPSDQEETSKMDKALKSLAAIAVMLSLAASSTPEEVETAVKQRLDVAAGLETSLASVRTSLKLDDKADAALIVSTASSLAAKAADATPDPTKWVPMETYKTLASAMSEQQKTNSETRATQAVEEAIKAGKVVPAQKEYWLAMASKDPAAFAEYAKNAPVIVAPGEKKHDDVSTNAKTENLTDEEKAICSNMGISHADFIKSRGEQAA